MKSYPELVLEELQRDSTPRSSVQIEAEITARTGVTPHKTAVHGAIIALRKRPNVHLIHTLACGRALGIDLISNPDLLLQDEYAARSAGWFWKANNCNSFADSGDFVGLTKRINGGDNGLADRQARYAVAKKALGI